MRIEQADYAALKKHLVAILAQFTGAERECNEVMAFISSIENDIVEK
jgi:hypothetical protein